MAAGRWVPLRLTRKRQGSLGPARGYGAGVGSGGLGLPGSFGLSSPLPGLSSLPLSSRTVGLGT